MSLRSVAIRVPTANGRRRHDCSKGAGVSDGADRTVVRLDDYRKGFCQVCELTAKEVRLITVFSGTAGVVRKWACEDCSRRVTLAW